MGRAPESLQLHATALLLRFFLGDLALAKRATDQQPRCEIEKARRQPHALGCIEDADAAGEDLRFLAARAIEIARGALDERHAFFEDVVELFGGLKPLSEGDHGVAAERRTVPAIYVTHDPQRYKALTRLQLLPRTDIRAP